MGTDEIINALVKSKLKIARQDVRIVGNKIRIYVREWAEKERGAKTEGDVYLRMQHLKRAIPNVIVNGYPNAVRAVVKKNEKANENELLVEGYGLRQCMNTDGVIGTQTRSNHIMEMKEVLGIEAARYGLFLFPFFFSLFLLPFLLHTILNCPAKT